MKRIVHITPQFAVTGALEPGPMLAHCASGLSSAIAWAPARGQPADAVLQRLAAAGLDLEGQHDPRRIGQIPRALDVGDGV